MTQSILDVLNVFNLLEQELTNQKKGGGKQQPTEPYRHFEDSMNEIYDYVKDVFETNEKNKKEYRDSVKNMDRNTDKNCNCDNYKADKNTTMKSSINGTSVIFTLKESERSDSDTKIKNEWIL
jgi:hypothetical protein